MVVMLVVSDIEKSVEFYNKLFGLQIVADFGANKTLTGGLALQTQETYKKFIENDTISYGGNNFELYFEVDDFDNFVDKLSGFDIIDYIIVVADLFQHRDFVRNFGLYLARVQRLYISLCLKSVHCFNPPVPSPQRWRRRICINLFQVLICNRTH